MQFSWPPSSWPAFIVGMTLLIYWLKVMQMVLGQRRSTGRAANFVPREPLGRVIRVVWVPVVVLWIFVPLLTSCLARPPALLRPWGGLYGNTVAGWVAAALAIATLAVTWVCWIKMGTSWRMGIDPTERT